MGAIFLNIYYMNKDFEYLVDRFGDVTILRYKVDGFEDLSLSQKRLLYYLSQAAIAGRDILYDQNCRYNLSVKNALETLYISYQGDRTSQDFLDFESYLKLFWFSNGSHHPYSGDKHKPTLSIDFLREAFHSISYCDPALEREVLPMIFDDKLMPKSVNQAQGEDLILTSACNYYQNVTMQQAVEFYEKMKDPNDSQPLSYGLNSKLVSEEGVLAEDIWRVGGGYSKQLTDVVYWLKLALQESQNDKQRQVIEKLIEFNISGNLKHFDQYAILWLEDTDSHIDFVCGFTETYGDPLGLKASWESIVSFKNVEASRRTEIIASAAQWFEDNSPIDPLFKKREVRGVSAKVITAAMLGGDCYPLPPIGINLPNSDWIRREHGSKSVTIENITEAYDQLSKNSGFVEEFILPSQQELIRQYAF